MTITPINLLKGEQTGTDTNFRDALPVNMYGVIKPTLGAAGFMVQTPGLTKYGEGSGVDRGGVYNERFSNLYRVSDSEFVSIDSAGNKTVLGSIPGSDTVSLPYSFNTQGIVADGRFYLYDSTNGFREVTDSDLGAPIDATWIDGYYFFTDGEFIYHTDITSESSIDPLKFATSEFSPDPSLGVAKTQDNKVAVFNRYTTEYFVNAATANFAFQRVAQRAVKAGIVGTHCKCEIGGKFYIMGGPKEEGVSIHVLGVGSVTTIATREVDKVIAKYTEAELSTSVLETYEDDGYSFLLVHLPDEVLQFNVTLAERAGIDQAWAILKTDVIGERAYRAKFMSFDPRRGQWVCGDKRDNTLGIIDNSVTTHYDELVKWVLFTPLYLFESQSIDSFEIEIVPGFTAEDDATVFISQTYDAVTYGRERTVPYGRPKGYGERFIYYRGGYVRNWTGWKLRGVTRSKMAFALCKVTHG